MHSISLQDGTIIKLKSTPQEFTADRWHHFFYYLTLSENISPDNIGDYDNKLKDYISRDRKEDALNELNNIKLARFNALSKVNLHNLAFGNAIDSIGKTKISDYSDENVTQLIDGLGKKGLTISEVKESIQLVKKKLMRL